MWKNLLARLGVGGASVDLQLDRDAFRVGEEVTGKIVISGGTVAQKVNDLTVSLVMEVRVHNRLATRTVHRIPVLHQVTVPPQPHREEVPFSFVLPANLAISSSSVRYGFRTQLDVDFAVDPKDFDPITVLPDKPTERLFRAIEQLGFRRKAEWGKLTAYGQEFEYFSANPQLPIKEWEFLLRKTADTFYLLSEVEWVRGGWLAREAERKLEIAVPVRLLEEGQEQALVAHLKETLERVLADPHHAPQISLHSWHLGQSPGHPGHWHGGHAHGHVPGTGIGPFAAGMVGGFLLAELLDELGDAVEAAGDMLDGDMFDGDDGDWL
ncbi:MAG: sporulation protein [Calditerricola sp.]|nr:sporulation protein [Calditerricola sp.]